MRPEQMRVYQVVADLGRLIDQILSGLGWELRTVFIMYEIEGMSSKEIAEVLGVSRGTVASRLRLGREAFQRNLQRHRARTEAIRPSSRAAAAALSGSVARAAGANGKPAPARRSRRS